MKNRIRALRQARSLRQEDLADLRDVSRQTIVAIENDKYDPSLELTMKLARLLETPVEELFTLEGCDRPDGAVVPESPAPYG